MHSDRGVFEKVLVANRGEIALRIISACRELGIKTVAVYSEADRDALHVKYADEDVCIGPYPSPSSYLNISSIVSAAEITEADAIHPGYGFLSENVEFARACGAAGIAFVGGRADLLDMLGDKIAARRLAVEAGVPVLSGSGDPVVPGAEARALAEALGLPNSSLSFHLAQLNRAGLIRQERRSRSLIYSADYGAMNALLSYLMENCCGGAASCAPDAGCVPADPIEERKIA